MTQQLKWELGLTCALLALIAYDTTRPIPSPSGMVDVIAPDPIEQVVLVVGAGLLLALGALVIARLVHRPKRPERT